MHEVSICESIVDILKQEAEKQGASKIKSVRLLIGEMAGVVDDSLNFAFEIVSKGTVAEGAEVIIEHSPLMARCKSCGKEFHIVGYAFSCAHCDGPEIEVVSGRELQIEEIDLEV
jgi:hydrogenase nickel incorporation protein HypA/HybF